MVGVGVRALPLERAVPQMGKRLFVELCELVVMQIDLLEGDERRALTSPKLDLDPQLGATVLKEAQERHLSKRAVDDADLSTVPGRLDFHFGLLRSSQRLALSQRVYLMRKYQWLLRFMS